MYKKLFLSALMLLAIQALVLPPALATDCSDTSYGVSTLRGDAQYPPGWQDSPIEITPPDEFVYGVIDGSVLPQQFLHIKAKLRNRLDRQMRAGTLRAAARYRKRTDYQPDLSADPPKAGSREPNFSTSLSAPIPIDGLASDMPQTFAFNFSDEPIPVGITDLYLIVTFQGMIDGSERPAEVIGIKDLNETTHFTIWNLRDYYAFWEEPRSVMSILNNQADYDKVFNVCRPSAELHLRPNFIFTSVYIGFDSDNTETPIFVAEYSDLYPGHYGRIIVLLDVGQDDIFYLYRLNYFAGGCTIGNYDSSNPISFGGCKPSSRIIQCATVNQQSAQGFSVYNNIKIARQSIKTHVISGVMGFCPDWYPPSVSDRLHQEFPPANDEPVGIKAINFP